MSLPSLRFSSCSKLTECSSIRRQFGGILDVYRKTLASDGVAGLYRGFGVRFIFLFLLGLR